MKAIESTYNHLYVALEAMKNEIMEYVKSEVGDGVLMLRDHDDAVIPYVVVTDQHDDGSDEHFEARALALRIFAKNDVQFYALRTAEGHIDDATPEDLSSLPGLWYVLDWDMGNLFQHNVERIAHHLSVACEDNN